MQDEGSIYSSSLKAFQNNSQVGYFCMYAMFLNVVKRMKFKTILAFGILVVASGFMEFHGCVQIQETKHFDGGKCLINFLVH